MKYAFYWLLDYLYVAKYHIATLFDKTTAASYRTPNGQPVLLIPGIYENWRFMKPVASLLHNAGYDVHVVDELGNNSGTIEGMAKIVQQYISIAGLTDVVIVAHSKGGLVGKYTMSLVNNPAIIHGLIAINTPFSGSKYAYILPFRALRIFIPHSKILTFLTELTALNSRIISIYGAFDPHIPGGSKLDGAHNLQLETVNGHFRPLGNTVVHAAVLKGITQLSTI